MTLARAAVAVAWLAVLAGLLLAGFHATRHRPPRSLLWLHPLAATAALICAWTAATRLPGPPDYAFNSGAMVITLAFAAGAFLFALRRIPVRPPLLVIIMHGAVAVGGCALLTVGLAHVGGA